MTTATYNQAKARVRAKISGTVDRPRLSVHVSNRHITAQLVDDVAGKTLALVTTNRDKTAPTGNLTEKAHWVGEQLATLAQKRKIKQVVFDRGGKIYHGRLDKLAEAARAKGLEF